MNGLQIPNALLGEDIDDLNIFFYLREKGPDQIKLKLHYTQNMFCFMLKGVKEIINDRERFSMNDEQIGLVPSGNMLMNERVTLKKEFESLLLFFSNAYLSEFLAKFNVELTDLPIDQSAIITFPKDEYLLNFQRSMKLLEENFSKKHFRLAKMEELLLYLLEKYPQKTKGFLALSIAKEKHFSLSQVVQSHKFKNLNTVELAFLCNMSLSTFKRRFKELYKTSPKKYLIAERMNKAKQLLKVNKRPSEIYFELGYENLSSFSNEFKKHFGIPPKAYQLQS
ncbi:MAG: AraC family transcriptional regulator [Bacteroidia bacterium]|nr:AraC family transcriptional regulator [Bacteroidia bacterium]